MEHSADESLDYRKKRRSLASECFLNRFRVSERAGLKGAPSSDNLLSVLVSGRNALVTFPAGFTEIP